MNLLTIIVIIIFAIFLLRGYRKGFIKSLASMASIIVSLVLVHFATPYVTDFLKTQTPVYDYILKKCQNTFDMTDSTDTNDASARSEKDADGQAAQQGGAPSPTGTASGNIGTALQEQVIENLPIPAALKTLLKENNTPQRYTELAVKTFSEYVPGYMANLILSILSFVATWLLVISFMWLAVMMLDVISGLPVIHGINQILGLVLGFAQGLVVVWIGFLIITVFSNTDAGRQLMAMIAESPVLETLYDSNILLNLLTDLLANFM